MSDNTCIKWAVCQPLNGGMAIGYEEALGCPPAFIISNNDKNDEHYINYMNVTRGLDIPVIKMDWDLTEFRDEDHEALFKEHNHGIEIVAYVPVCAGLSMLNACNSEDSSCRRGDPNNDQNQNMYNLTKFILDNIKPKVACFENAPAAYTASGQGVVDMLLDIAKERNYSTTVEKVDTYDHGIPQHRKRTFLYFWNTETVPYLTYEKLETPNLVDYFKMIPKDASFLDLYPNEIDTALDFTYDYIMDVYGEGCDNIFDIFKKEFPKKETMTGLAFIQEKNEFPKAAEWADKKLEGINEEDNPDEFKRWTKAARIFRHCQTKLDDNKGFWDSSIVVYGSGNFVNAIISKNLFRIVHPTEHRSLNMRELQWLMGLPHDYELMEAKKNWQHVSQSVPVKTAKHTAEQCKLFVQGDLVMSHSDYIKQSNEKQRVDYESDSHSPTMDVEEW